MRGRGLGTPWWQYVGLTLLIAGTVALCYLALTRDTAVEPEDATEPVGASTSNSPSSSESGSESTVPEDSSDLPLVPDQRRADFLAGDELPDDATTFDAPGNETGLALTPEGLTHGAPSGSASGLGLLETELTSDVSSLGFRVAFPDGASGSAALVAWQSSAVAALDAGKATPPTGMRLVATKDSWSLSVVDGDDRETILEGSYEAQPGPVEFQILRSRAQVFVVDPAGEVATTTQAVVESLAGPWASWGLLESGPDQTPAVIESVWAG